MKNKIFIILYFLTLLSYSQNLKIVYNIRYHVNLDTINNKNIKDNYTYILNGIPHIKGELNILNNESNFEQVGYLKKSKNSKENFINNYYSNSVSKKVHSLLGNSMLGSSKIIYDNMYYNFSDFNWELTKETKKIGNYICYKAVGIKKSVKVEALKRNFNEDLIAWYCPQLPYNFGPELYVGLPGLVFEAYNANGQGKHWLIDKIIRNNKSEITLPKGKSLHYVEAEELTLKDFNKFYKRLKK